MTGLSPVPGRIEAGVVLHLRVEPMHSVTSVAADTVRALADIVGTAPDTELLVATMRRPRAGILGVFNFTDELLSRIWDPGESFFIGAVGSERLDVNAHPLADGGWSLGVRAASLFTSGGNERLNEVVDVVRDLSPQAQLISGGADIQPLFDAQELSMQPYGRGKIGWARAGEQCRICGYYWLTLLGPDVVSRLPPPPQELAAVSMGQGLAIQLGDSAEIDAVVRSKIPALRDWILPVLPGWMVGRDPGFTPRLYEGPVVPTHVAFGLTALVDGRVSVREPAELAQAYELTADLTVVTKLSLLFEETRSEWRELAMEGVAGSMSALERGLAEGWIDGEAFDDLLLDGLRVQAVGPPGTIQLLLFVVDAILDGFDELGSSGPEPVVNLIDLTVS